MSVIADVKHTLLTIERFLNCKYRTIVVGDFNIRDIDWNKLKFNNTKTHKLFSKFFYTNQPIEQIIKFPTRIENILDLVFTKNI